MQLSFNYLHTQMQFNCVFLVIMLYARLDHTHTHTRIKNNSVNPVEFADFRNSKQKIFMHMQRNKKKQAKNNRKPFTKEIQDILLSSGTRALDFTCYKNSKFANNFFSFFRESIFAPPTHANNVQWNAHFIYTNFFFHL